MSPLNILKAARKLISDPKHWTTGVLARDKFGQNIYPTHSNAVCWCSLGALTHVANKDINNRRLASKALHDNLQELFLTHFNDSNIHATVLALFDYTITQREITTS